MSQTGTTQSSGQPTADKHAIRPFKVNFPEAELTDLRKRINATKWPEGETVTDASQGVQFATIQNLSHYWATQHDWRKCEARLNALPQFITEIDGLDIHFIHVRSKHENALPLIVTHGWPGSVIEQLKIIDPLSNPTAQGASAAEATMRNKLTAFSTGVAPSRMRPYIMTVSGESAPTSINVVLKSSNDIRNEMAAEPSRAGRKNGSTMLRAPRTPAAAQIVVMESTYGDRLHRPYAASVEEFYAAIAATFAYAFECRFDDDDLDFEEFMSNLWKLESLKFKSVRTS